VASARQTKVLDTAPGQCAMTIKGWRSSFLSAW
jgi:hypothetical protein